jgi:probable rRNA maturation factor
MSGMIDISNISELTASGYCIATLRQIIKEFFADFPFPYYVSAVLANDAQMRKLNRKYLGRDRETDVIAFSFLDTYPERIFIIDQADFDRPYLLADGLEKDRYIPFLQIGEAYISMEQALAYSGINSTTINREINWLLLHSLLHLIGYSDDTDEKRRIMFARAEQFLSVFYKKQSNKKRGKV